MDAVVRRLQKHSVWEGGVVWRAVQWGGSWGSNLGLWTAVCAVGFCSLVFSVASVLHVCLQDGSCNGLQHYAALGRDKAGAQSVNLWPYDRPQDVYSDVCDLVSWSVCRSVCQSVSQPLAL